MMRLSEALQDRWDLSGLMDQVFAPTSDVVRLDGHSRRALAVSPST